jgi:hypothetical protein
MEMCIVFDILNCIIYCDSSCFEWKKIKWLPACVPYLFVPGKTDDPVDMDDCVVTM